MSGEQKVWIITRRMGDNFGSSLQAYALQQTLCSLGYKNSRIIRYDEYCIRWKIRPFIYDCIYWAMRLFKPLSNRFIPTTYKWFAHRDLQRRRFVEFEEKYLRLTPEKYAHGDSETIAREIREHDVCICGSDQIWSPLLFDPVMFMNYCIGKPTNTIAYAPSIGVSRIQKHREEMAKLISNVKHLSVREFRGAEIIKELTGRDAQVVADPTLLLSKADWEKIAVYPHTKQPYILCYFLGYEPLPEQFVNELSRSTGYAIYVAYSYRYPPRMGGHHLSTLGPGEFLGYVANAEYVCTNSFHGTIFSILFEKDFFCFERKTADHNHSQNSRIESLLKHTGLESRLYDWDSGVNPCPEIDYPTVKERIQMLKGTSLKYLASALGSKKQGDDN